MSNTLSTNQSNNLSSSNLTWKSKNIQITHTQMGYITSNISQHTLQAKYRPLTPNRTDTVIFFTHPCAFTPHPQHPRYVNE